ncbi:hypothetical protein CPB86DRAFT_830689 [Serendipita vermifera]|nr:hypothetical protein CPB86DRAFT_830689 [Serendipita vermifera]
MISATYSAIFEDSRKPISLDFVAMCIYALVAMADFQFRTCPTCDIKSDLQAQDALHVIFSTLIGCLIIFGFSQLTYEIEMDSSECNVLLGPWKLKAWGAFLLLIIAQIISADNSGFAFIASCAVDSLVALLTAWYLLIPLSLGKILPGRNSSPRYVLNTPQRFKALGHESNDEPRDNDNPPDYPVEGVALNSG